MMELPDKAERKRLVCEGAARALNWIEHAKPGASQVFHEGFLIDDRETNLEADGLAQAFYTAAKQGLVFLTQRRIGDGYYHYLATRSSRSH